MTDSNPLEQVEGIYCIFIHREDGKITSLYDVNENRIPLGGLIESPGATRSEHGAFCYKAEEITQDDLVRDLEEYMKEVKNVSR